MNLSEAIFIVQLVLAIVLLLIKLYNVMHGAERSQGIFPYSIREGLLILICYLLLHGIGFAVMLVNVSDNLVYHVLFSVERFMLPIMVILTFVEIIYHLKNQALSAARGRYRPER